MTRTKEFLWRHRPVVVLMGIVLVLTAVPILDTFLAVGNAWQGILPTFTDEPTYASHVHAIGEGYLNDGNPYFLEHRYDPPIVIFGGAWMNAIPLFAGVPFNAALMINFIFWSLMFAVLAYWLFRECSVPPWVAVIGTVFLYLQSYAHVWRSVNLQTVYPFYFLFYIALFRLIQKQSRRNIFFLGLATGATFYFFAYLWQVAVATLGLLLLYALVRKNWPLVKASALSALIGGAIGLPMPLYTLWLSRRSPYFWESMGRFGLVHTHLPMAEVIYSGGWVGAMLIFLVLLYWKVRSLREDTLFNLLCVFVGVSGLGLWIMQGSNLVTGLLLETGEHIRELIFPWLVFTTVFIGAFLWKRRAHLTKGWKILSVAVIALLSAISLNYAASASTSFFNIRGSSELWRTEQLYAKPFAWLEQNVKNPAVIWSDPHDYYVSSYIPTYTRHFTLFAPFAMWELLSDNEFRERYLVSQYFNNPTVADLENGGTMALYLGRQDLAHNAETIDRGVKICRILFFWDKNKNCGTELTPQQLLGEKFFQDLQNRFQNDIKPNIKAYLKKYHVSYILKDKVMDVNYRPETLGATLVYSDDRYEIWHLPPE